MKILFIENRYKTYFWEAIAQELVKEGHEIFWIVQSHSFKPLLGKIFVIPYYKKSDKVEKNYTPDLKKVIEGDRGINYFRVDSLGKEGHDDFIFYYHNKINKIIDEIQPDISFGECTLFHEKLVLQSCRNRGILHLVPTSCRYPAGRLSFYKWDTLEAFAGCGETLPYEQAKKIVDDIIHRRTKLDYMVKPLKLSKIEILSDKIRLTLGYLKGERFNTPHPLAKRKLDKVKDQNIVEWDNHSVKSVDESDKRYKVLYALQMQPEANIDLWGYPNNDQLGVIQKITAALSKDAVLYVKPNPKSKYELSRKLLDFIRNNDNVIALHHKSKMGEVFKAIDLLVSVTGTVSIEGAMSNKPTVMLGKGLVSDLENCYNTDTVEGIQEALRLVQSNQFPRITEAAKIDYMNQTYHDSYIGVVGDSLHNRQYLQDEHNFNLVLDAIKDTLIKVKDFKPEHR
jgi:hypothetical protein